MHRPLVRRVLPALPALLATGVLLMLSSLPMAAQHATGRITGRIIDARTGLGLSDVGIQVVGALPGAATTSGGLSGVDGRFTLNNVRAGTVTLHVRRMGYQPTTVTAIMVPPGGVVEQDVTLETATLRLTAVTVSAEAERGSVNAALDQQRTAAGIVSAVTAEQIARSPDSDAAQAIQRVGGVTVQDGKYVQVRGLGERYTTTSLNGARIPSPEPERKVVPLDLFPSGLIQTVTTAKTFTPDLPGDFSGAAVDIRTREFPAERQIAYSMSVGHNSAASGRDVYYAPGVGGESFAAAGAARFLPSPFRETDSLDGISTAERNALISSFRDVWSAGRRAGRLASSLAASVGGNDLVFGQRVGYLLSGSYSYSQEAKVGEERALARPTSNPGVAEAYNRYTGSTGRTSALVGGLANFSTMVGRHSRLMLNTMYSRTADNDARVERGFNEEFATDFEIQRLDYVQRSIFSSQLAGEHTRGRHTVEWAVTGSGVDREQPDRSEIVYVVENGARLWLNGHPEAAVRTFADLTERSLETRADYRLALGNHQLKLGGIARSVDRDAETRAYSITAPVLTEADRALPPEELFGSRHTGESSTVFQLGSPSAGGSYGASDRLAAGYVMTDAELGTWFRLVAGARLERSSVRIDAVSSLGERIPSVREFTDVLPALALTYRPTPSQNLRFSASRTLARPEYRELAGIRGREVIGAVDIRGNPSLERTLIDNGDLRWEWYPRRAEVLSIALFGKQFDRPIERVVRASGAAPVIEWVNAVDGTTYGVELEARMNLDRVADVLNPFSAFGNVTVMKSAVSISPEDASATVTRESRPLAGQAPYVVNAGLTYAHPAVSRLSATMLYNRVGDRIRYTGAGDLADVVERPRNVLDVSLRFPLRRHVSARVDAKNLLDADNRTTQGNVIHELFRAGRTVSLGVSVER